MLHKATRFAFDALIHTTGQLLGLIHAHMEIQIYVSDANSTPDLDHNCTNSWLIHMYLLLLNMHLFMHLLY